MGAAGGGNSSCTSSVLMLHDIDAQSTYGPSRNLDLNRTAAAQQSLANIYNDDDDSDTDGGGISARKSRSRSRSRPRSVANSNHYIVDAAAAETRSRSRSRTEQGRLRGAQSKGSLSNLRSRPQSATREYNSSQSMPRTTNSGLVVISSSVHNGQRHRGRRTQRRNRKNKPG